MSKYFECTVKYEKMTEKGTNKLTTEKYVLDSLSFTESEANMLAYIEPFVNGECYVHAIKRCGYEEVVLSDNEEDDKFYEVRLLYVSVDENTMKEKKVPYDMLFQAKNIEGVLSKVKEQMKGTMADYESIKVQETAILDFIPYK